MSSIFCEWSNSSLKACDRDCAVGKANLFRRKSIEKDVNISTHVFDGSLVCMLLIKVWKIPWYHQYVCFIKVIGMYEYAPPSDVHVWDIM